MFGLTLVIVTGITAFHLYRRMRDISHHLTQKDLLARVQSGLASSYQVTMAMVFQSLFRFPIPLAARIAYIALVIGGLIAVQTAHTPLFKPSRKKQKVVQKQPLIVMKQHRHKRTP